MAIVIKVWRGLLNNSEPILTSLQKTIHIQLLNMISWIGSPLIYV